MCAKKNRWLLYDKIYSFFDTSVNLNLLHATKSPKFFLAANFQHCTMHWPFVMPACILYVFYLCVPPRPLTADMKPHARA